MIYKITCRFTGALRFEGEFGSLKLCVEAAELMEHAAASACDDVLAERVPA